jgi:hypothetical protein
MNTFLRNALAALVVATAGVAASAPAATAGDFSFGFSIGGPGGGVVVRDRDHRGGWNRFEGHRGWDRGYCKPRKALKKPAAWGCAARISFAPTIVAWSSEASTAAIRFGWCSPMSAVAP